MQLVIIKKVLTQLLPDHQHVCQELCYPYLVVLPLPGKKNRPRQG